MVSHSVATYGKIGVNAILVFVALVSCRELFIAKNEGYFQFPDFVTEMPYCEPRRFHADVI